MTLQTPAVRAAALAVAFVLLPFTAFAQGDAFGAIAADHPTIGALAVVEGGHRVAVQVERSGDEVVGVVSAVWITPDGDRFALRPAADGSGFRLSGSDFLLDIGGVEGGRADLTLVAADGSSETFEGAPIDPVLAELMLGWSGLYREAGLLAEERAGEVLVAWTMPDPLEVALLGAASLASAFSTFLAGTACVAGVVPTAGVAATGALPVAAAATAKLAVVCGVAAGGAVATWASVQELYTAVTDPEARAEALRAAEQDLTVTAISVGVDAGDGVRALYLIRSVDSVEGIRRVARAEARSVVQSAETGIVVALAAEGFAALANAVALANDDLRRLEAALANGEGATCDEAICSGFWRTTELIRPLNVPAGTPVEIAYDEDGGVVTLLLPTPNQGPIRLFEEDEGVFVEDEAVVKIVLRSPDLGAEANGAFGLYAAIDFASEREALLSFENEDGREFESALLLFLGDGR